MILSNKKLNNKNMKLNEKDLKSILEKIVSETTFEINPDDSGMQQKIEKIKGDSTLYNPAEDEITIGNANESIYAKSDIVKLIAETKQKKKGKNDDYINAIKKADREMDYELNGPGWKAKDKAHKNKKRYDRRERIDDCVTESVFSKADVSNMILERKYNGKVYSKNELLDYINKSEE